MRSSTATSRKSVDRMVETFPPQFQRINIEDRYRGCLLGGAVGDALGAPVEFMSRAVIQAYFGVGGIQEYAPAFGRVGAITDDTQMTLFTAEGLLRSWARDFSHDPKAIPGEIAMAYQRWLCTQGVKHPMHNHCLQGALIAQEELFARRAPGLTCLAGLQGMAEKDDVSKNDSKGCGGVMRVAPIGMYFARLAQYQNAKPAELTADAFALGCRAAAITHGHLTGQLASGTFVVILMDLLNGTPLDSAIDSALGVLAGHAHNAETSRAIGQARRLATERPHDAQALAQLGAGWIAEEALAIAVYCALSAPDLRSGVVLAVNHGGDSDSTGSMAGQLLGAMYGAMAIPRSWLGSLELHSLIAAMADDLAAFVMWRAGGDAAQEYGRKPRQCHQSDALKYGGSWRNSG